MAERIAIIGLFRNGLEISDGQSIKTRIVAQELERAAGKAYSFRQIDTYGWKKRPIQLMLQCVWAVLNSEHVLFMTDEGGIRVFPWLLTVANVLRKCKVHYIVIGGWLTGSLDDKPLRRFWLKKLTGIYVETSTMRIALENRGFENVVLLPNCKRLAILREDELAYGMKAPYPLCTFSRVMREKGIEDAVNAVGEINRRYGRPIYTLDIYGQVDERQLDWFDELKASFPEGVRYGGVIPYHQSTEVLKNYFALLFPTRFYTEGVPGTIIDAYAAGLPVIASKWESFSDILDEDTGIGYPFDSRDDLIAILEKVAADPSVLDKRRSACLKMAKLYTPEQVMNVLLNHLNG